MRRALPLLALLAACGPMALPDAERACIKDAQLAQHPRGSVAFGVSSDGSTAAQIELGISSDYLLHRDPDQVFAACVRNRAGQQPSRPFSAMPESRS
jgi:hypothetical protein